MHFWLYILRYSGCNKYLHVLIHLNQLIGILRLLHELETIRCILAIHSPIFWLQQILACWLFKNNPNSKKKRWYYTDEFEVQKRNKNMHFQLNPMICWGYIYIWNVLNSSNWSTYVSLVYVIIKMTNFFPCSKLKIWYWKRIFKSIYKYVSIC